MRRSLDRYLEEVNRFPLLTEEEERSLARAYRLHDDREAAKRLVTANLRFVIKVANGYRGYGLRAADLIQEGNLGLMRAVEKFDPDQGIRLVAYAVWWIRAYIQSYVLQQWSLVKLGTTQAQRKLFFALARTRREVERSGAEGDVDDDVARLLQVRPEELRAVSRRIEGRDVSLDAPDPGGGSTQMDRIPSPSEPPDELLSRAMEAAERERGVSRALAQLDERERHIVEHRLMADEPTSLQELGNRLGFSRERARQIELRARGKLRAALQAFAEVAVEPIEPAEPAELLAAG